MAIDDIFASTELEQTLDDIETSILDRDMQGSIARSRRYGIDISKSHDQALHH